MLEAINILSVLAAVVANMVLGSIWYGPLFGSRWIKATGRNSETGALQATMKKDLPVAMGLMMVFSVVTAIVVSILVFRYAGNLSSALALAAMLWLGFSLPAKINDVFFGGNNRQLLWIDGGWMLISIFVTTLIIFVWR